MEKPQVRVVEMEQQEPDAEIAALLEDMEGCAAEMLREIQRASSAAIDVGKQATVSLTFRVQPPKESGGVRYVTICPSIKSNIPRLPPSSAFRFVDRAGRIKRNDEIQSGMFAEDDEQNA